MVDRTNVRSIPDQHGWALGLRAVFKGVFGTNTEVRLLNGGIEHEIAHAQMAVGVMAEGAKDLLRTLGDRPSAETPTEMTDLLRNIP